MSKPAHAPDSMTRTAAETQLAMLLAGCSDAALHAMTPEYLARTHKVPIARCQERLHAARRDRAHD